MSNIYLIFAVYRDTGVTSFEHAAQSLDAAKAWVHVAYNQPLLALGEENEEPYEEENLTWDSYNTDKSDLLFAHPGRAWMCATTMESEYEIHEVPLGM